MKFSPSPVQGGLSAVLLSASAPPRVDSSPDRVKSGFSDSLKAVSAGSDSGRQLPASGQVLPPSSVADGPLQAIELQAIELQAIEPQAAVSEGLLSLQPELLATTGLEAEFRAGPEQSAESRLLAFISAGGTHTGDTSAANTSEMAEAANRAEAGLMPAGTAQPGEVLTRDGVLVDAWDQGTDLPDTGPTVVDPAGAGLLMAAWVAADSLPAAGTPVPAHSETRGSLPRAASEPAVTSPGIHLDSLSGLPTAVDSVSAISIDGFEGAAPAAGSERLVSAAGSASSSVTAGLMFSGPDQRQATVSGQQAGAPAVTEASSSASGAAFRLAGMDLSPGQPGWVEQLGRQLLLQSAQGSSQARIRLDPPELGSLTIRIQLTDQSAAVSFVSPHAAVRDALEQQSARLTEMFKEQDLDLLDVSVSDEQSAGSEDRQQGAGTGSHADAEGPTQTSDSVLSQPGAIASDRLVDQYV